MANNRFTITFADGTTQTVTTTLEDRLNFESTLRKNKHWGSLSDNALKMPAFVAWSAAKRLGLTTLSWDEFSRGEHAVLDVELFTEEPTELEVEGLGEDSTTEASTTFPSSSASDSE